MSAKGTKLTTKPATVAAAENAAPVATKKSTAEVAPIKLPRMFTEADPGIRARLFVDTERGKATKIELTGKQRGQWYVHIPADTTGAARVSAWIDAEQKKDGLMVLPAGPGRFVLTILALQKAEKPVESAAKRGKKK